MRKKRVRDANMVNRVAMALHGIRAHRLRQAWERLEGSARKGFRKQATGAIVTMCAPTEKMIDAGMNMGCESREQAERVWRAMCEAAIERYDDGI